MYSRNIISNTYISIYEFSEIRIPYIIHIWPLEQCNSLFISLKQEMKFSNSDQYKGNFKYFKCILQIKRANLYTYYIDLHLTTYHTSLLRNRKYIKKKVSLIKVYILHV